MSDAHSHAAPTRHTHNFLGAGHQGSERKTWTVIWLCGAMMVGEIVGGYLFGSIALVADGLHMSTHAGALLLAAVAYTYSRTHAEDSRFSFGTGKLGDLAGFTSAIVLAMISLLIGYEAISRLFSPVPIHFGEAIPIAVLGLAVNLLSAWLLSSSGHHHHHGHGHGHDHGHDDHHDHHHAAVHQIPTAAGMVLLNIFEDGVPPRFRIRRQDGQLCEPGAFSLETVRPDGARQAFSFQDHGEFLESVEEIPEPHAFDVRLTLSGEQHVVVFAEHEAHDRDNNMRAAVVHVIADAAVSVLVIAGLILARQFGWLWIDPLVGIVGACVIASWAYGLIRDTGAILLDMNPDRKLSDQIRATVEGSGDKVTDLHLWRLGPGHLGAIVGVETATSREVAHYHAMLRCFPALSHLTVELVRKRHAH